MRMRTMLAGLTISLLVLTLPASAGMIVVAIIGIL